MTVGFLTTETHKGDQKLLSPDAEMRWRPGLLPQTS